MGRRSGAETVVGILSAFVERKRWRQAELARKLEVTVPALRRHLVEMRALLPLVDAKDHPDVYWEVPRDWNPHGVLLDAPDAAALVRLLARAPRSRERDRLLQRVARGDPRAAPSPAIRASSLSREEQTFLPLVEDAVSKRVALRMKYASSHSGHTDWRHVSIAHVTPGPPARFVGVCHRDGAVKRFRVDGIADATLDRDEAFRTADDDALARFDAESVGAFRGETDDGECAFVVSNPEARWVARNLVEGMRGEPLGRGGLRVVASGKGIEIVARFVVGLGGAARAETAALAERVRGIAEEAMEANRRAGRAKRLSAAGRAGGRGFSGE